MNSTEKTTALSHFEELERVLGNIEEVLPTIGVYYDAQALANEARQHIEAAKQIVESAQTTEHLAEQILAIFAKCKEDIATAVEIDATALVLSRGLADIAKLCQPLAPKKVEVEG